MKFISLFSMTCIAFKALPKLVNAKELLHTKQIPIRKIIADVLAPEIKNEFINQSGLLSESGCQVVAGVNWKVITASFLLSESVKPKCLCRYAGKQVCNNLCGLGR